MELSFQNTAGALIGRRFPTGIAFAVGGTFLFALKSIFIKFAFADGANAVTLLTLRLVFALPFYLGMLIYLRSKQPVASKTAVEPRMVIKAIALGFLGYYLSSFLDMSGLELISTQLERLTLFTYPAMIAILAWLFLGEQMNRWIIFALVLCYSGLATMYTQERNFASGENVKVGMLFVMGSALSFSLFVLFAKPTMQKMGSLKFTSLAMIGSAACVVVHFFVTQDFSVVYDITPRVWMIGILLAFVCTVIPSFLVNEAIIRLGATRTTIIGSSGPAITMVLAIAFLKEPTSPNHFIGMLLVLLGVACVARNK